jgi:hypothetical protein
MNLGDSGEVASHKPLLFTIVRPGIQVKDEFSQKSLI